LDHFNPRFLWSVRRQVGYPLANALDGAPGRSLLQRRKERKQTKQRKKKSNSHFTPSLCISIPFFTAVKPSLASPVPIPPLAIVLQTKNVFKSIGLSIALQVFSSLISFSRDCKNCGSFKCVAKSSGGAKRKSGTSNGALAGAVVGSLILVAIIVGLYFWYRRRANRADAVPEQEKEVPASAQDVLSRPDPTEKRVSIIRESTADAHVNASGSTVDLDPRSIPSSGILSQESQLRMPRNPFDDQNSIETAASEGSNVIPIAFVAPVNGFTSEDSTLAFQGPTRPPRSPELNLNLEHVNVSRDSLRLGAPSTRSGVSAVSSRMSYMSNGSYSSEFLKETPMIVTPVKAAVRQVVGVVKAEVIQAPSSAAPTPMTATFLKPPSTSRPSIRSPLAASFGPADICSVRSEEQDVAPSGNPFGDEHSPNDAEAGSPSSVTTFGVPSPTPVRSSTDTAWTVDKPPLPWAESTGSRPTSIMSSMTGTIVADVSSATRVYVGPVSAGQTPVSPYQTAMGKLVVPNFLGALEQQQQRALAHAQAQAQAQGLDPQRRVSGSSVLSATSTRADSILEAFPFVPPSPISNRPIRSPPVSPLAQQSFNGNGASTETESSQAPAQTTKEENPLEPPNRRVLGLSTASQLSTASTGLGSFPFQIDGSDLISDAPPTSTPSAYSQRASLDTIAITKDISSYPLPFDSDVGDSFGVNRPSLPN
jgi:hypothetical protein